MCSGNVVCRPRVEIGDQSRDRGVEFGQGKEALMAQARQDPALHH
jgi:hypothetical protein